MSDRMERILRCKRNGEEQEILEQQEADERRRQWMLRDVLTHIGDRYQPNSVSLDNYQTLHKGQAQILGRVRALAERLPELVKQGESIVWYGTPGTGKDHMMHSLLHIVTGRCGLSARWIPGYRLYARLRATISRSRGESEWEVLDELTGRNVLAVSDPIPPGADPSSWELNKLFAVIDQRYQNNRPTWLTMNVASEAEAAEKLTTQIWDRLIDRGHRLPCFWPSFRAERRPEA